MKNCRFFAEFFALAIVTLSCGKAPEEAALPNDIAEKPVMDTTPVDSFSSGAISVDVAERIRQSSRKYQDSLKKIAEEKALAAKLLEEQKALEKDLKKDLPKEEKPAKTEKSAEQKLVPAP